MRRRFRQVDVFGDKTDGAVAGAPFSGNPLAVVCDAEGLSTEAMQRFARWTNLSETIFLLPPTSEEADYRVRIFTPARELPFAGHPTLGACHVFLTTGGEPRAPDATVQECGAGLVKIRSAGGLAFSAPPLLRSGPVDEAFIAELADILRIARSDVVDAQWVDNGPGWVGLLLEDAAAVLAVEADFSRWRGEGSLDIGLIGAHPPSSPCAFEVRALFSDEQRSMREDPVTGSLNASLAQWLIGSGRARAPYVVSQGTKLGCSGRVYISQTPDGRLWIGGATTTAISGEIEI